MPLIEDDRVLLQKVADACDRLDLALRTHAKKLGRLALLAVISLGIAGVGLIVGGIGVKAAAEANDNAEQIEADRAQALSSGCIQYNVQRAQTRAALKLSLRALAPPGDLTPAQQAALDGYGRAVDEQLPFRDCSPAGIDAYYREPPKDPAVGG